MHLIFCDYLYCLVHGSYLFCHIMKLHNIYFPLINGDCYCRSKIIGYDLVLDVLIRKLERYDFRYSDNTCFDQVCMKMHERGVIWIRY